MQKWLISVNEKKLDLTFLFNQTEHFNWISNDKFDVDDILYIYVESTGECTIFKTSIENKTLYSDEYLEYKYDICLIDKKKCDEINYNLIKKYLNRPGINAIIVNGKLEQIFINLFNEQSLPNFWKITADKGAVKIDTFKRNNFVGIGWDLGDLTNKNREEIKSLYISEYGTPKSTTMHVTQINYFVNRINIGDYIISSDSSKKEYNVGKCISDYYYSHEKDDSNVNGPFINCRDVKWLYSIKWVDIDKELRKFIDSSASVSEIKNKNAKEKILEFSKSPSNFESDDKRNVIYFGAPGTGKSYNLNLYKDKLLVDFKDNYERVTFHPDYSYANFVGTYKPVPENSSISIKPVLENDSLNYKSINNANSITYKYVPGPFMRILKNALDNPDKPYVLIIEEINRANVAAVFGDVFQLLDRNDDFESEYPINATEDAKNYLNRNIIRLPSNLFILATMNSADQGVFPMDTAFKRRWDFKYLGIDDGENNIKETYVSLNDKKIHWNDIRKEINDELLSHGINEDKLIGPFFAFNGYQNQEIPEEIFKDIFKNKIIMYLFEDVARSIRPILFEGVLNDNKNITFSKICVEFDKNGMDVFCEKIRKNIKSKLW